MAAVMVRMNWATLPEGMLWLVSFPAVGVAATLAALELLSQHETEISEVLRELKIDHLLGAFGAFSAALVFASLGMPEEEAGALIQGASTSASADLVRAVDTTVQSQHSDTVKAAAIGGGVSLNLALTWVRGHVHAFLDEFELKGVWQRVETGGVSALLLIIIFLPLIALLIVAMLTVSLGIFGWMARQAQKWSDQYGRVPCAHCQHLVPPEALRCSACALARSRLGSFALTARRCLLSLLPRPVPGPPEAIHAAQANHPARDAGL